VLEDDYDSGYRYDGRPLEAIQSLDDSGRVVYIGTFSKVLFPAIRIGFLSLPPALVPAFAKAKWLADRHAPALEQLALAEFLGSGEFEQHLRRTRTRNGARRQALLAALDRHLGDPVEVTGANAGIHVLVWLRKRRRIETIIRSAESRGVGLYPAALYFHAAPKRQGFLFGYGTLDEVTQIFGRARRGLSVFRFASLYSITPCRGSTAAISMASPSGTNAIATSSLK